MHRIVKNKFISYGFLGIVNFFCFASLSCYFVVDQLYSYFPCPITSASKVKNQLQPLVNVKFLWKNFTENIPSLVTDPLLLRDIAQDALIYRLSVEKHNLHNFRFSENKTTRMTLNAITKTLRFIISTINEDEKRGGNYRINDPEFIKENFDCFSWGPQNALTKKKGIEDGKILLTRYTMYKIKGSHVKTSKYNHALYGLPASKEVPFCTKEQVLGGIFEKRPYKDVVSPLVWVTREGLDEALMQGSIFIAMEDVERWVRGFSVHRTTGFAGEEKSKDQKKQQSYWFFKEKDPIETKRFYSKCQRRKDVVFAGNTDFLPIGSIIAVKEKDLVGGKDSMRLGILADTGGAFKNNLHQLDQFVGISTKKVTNSSQVYAYMLYKK